MALRPNGNETEFAKQRTQETHMLIRRIPQTSIVKGLCSASLSVLPLGNISHWRVGGSTRLQQWNRVKIINNNPMHMAEVTFEKSNAIIQT